MSAYFRTRNAFFDEMIPDFQVLFITSLRARGLHKTVMRFWDRPLLLAFLKMKKITETKQNN